MPDGRAWPGLNKRLKSAGVTAKQVQVAWLKQAWARPDMQGDCPAHTKVLQEHIISCLNLLKQRFGNLRVVYLSSRIYAGYATTPLNPEPYAYESAFAVRNIILEQIKGSARLNFGAAAGKINSPLLLWGPYLWADGVKGRKIDKLVYKRDDLTRDGTHPSGKGCRKVAKVMRDFFKTDRNACGWFCKPSPKAKPAKKQPKGK